MCPLEVLPVNSRSPLSDHRSLLGAMTSRGIASEVTLRRAILGDPDRAIALERRICELSELYIDPAAGTFHEFIDAQVAITRDAQTYDARSTGASSNSVCASTLTEHAARLLGVNLQEIVPFDDEVDRTIIALTPYLRSEFVFARRAPHQQESEAMSIAVDRVPGLILGLRFMARLAVRAGMTNVTFQTVTGLLRRFNALIWCIAHAADVLVWRSGLMPFAMEARQKPFASRYVRIIRDLMPSRQQKRACALVDVLCRHAAWDGAERMAFIAYVGTHLPRLVAPRIETSLVEVRRPLQAKLQLRVLDLLPDDLFEQTCISLANSARKPGKGQ
jgi:hypothetical protein